MVYECSLSEIQTPSWRCPMADGWEVLDEGLCPIICSMRATSRVSRVPENSDRPSALLFRSAQGHAPAGQQTKAAEWGVGVGKSTQRLAKQHFQLAMSENSQYKASGRKAPTR